MDNRVKVSGREHGSQFVEKICYFLILRKISSFQESAESVAEVKRNAAEIASRRMSPLAHALPTTFARFAAH